MAGNVKTNSISLGDSATATQNFVLTTGVDGTCKLARGNLGATTADILTVDAAGNMAAGTQRLINRGNLLGTVSQAAGVPTGAVIERGSNANGEYVRFADGTQICWARLAGVAIAANVQGTISWTYPVVFIAAPEAPSWVGIPASSADVSGFQYLLNTSTTAMSQVFRNGATAQTVLTSAYSIGRWF